MSGTLPRARPRLRHSYDGAAAGRAAQLHQQQHQPRQLPHTSTVLRRRTRPLSLPNTGGRRRLPVLYVDWPYNARVNAVNKREHDLCSYYNLSDECCLVTKATVAAANQHNGGLMLVLPPSAQQLDYMAVPLKGQPYWGKMVPCYVYSMQLVNGHVLFTYAT